MSELQLEKNRFAQLVLVSEGGKHREHVVPVRAFPIGAPDRGVALVNVEGHEVVWIESLEQLGEPARGLIAEELASREFMPEVVRIASVSTFATPSTWTVETDRGSTQFTLKGEEDIRRVGSDSLLIADSHGVNFLIRDVKALDRHSRKILDRFL